MPLLNYQQKYIQSLLILKRDKDLRGPDFFDSEKYPTLKSSSIKQTSKTIIKSQVVLVCIVLQKLLLIILNT